MDHIKLMKAGDTRVLVNGRPFSVDYRIVSEENFQLIIKAYDKEQLSLKETPRSFSMEELKTAFTDGLGVGYFEGSNYGEPDADECFLEWLQVNYG